MLAAFADGGLAVEIVYIATAQLSLHPADRQSHPDWFAWPSAANYCFGTALQNAVSIVKQ